MLANHPMLVRRLNGQNAKSRLFDELGKCKSCLIYINNASSQLTYLSVVSNSCKFTTIAF